MKRYFLIILRICRRAPLAKMGYALDLYIFSELARLKKAGITPPVAPAGILSAHTGSFLRNMAEHACHTPEAGLLNHAQAAVFLVKSKKQVTRYRDEGRLPYTRNEAGHYQYRDADLERLFVALHGFPKGGFLK